MISLRQLTGWLALVIASVGPLPLWAHHALCHAELCDTDLCHNSQCHEHDGSEQAAHSHAGQCGYDHHHRATSTAKNNSDDATGQKPVGLSGTSTEHDCVICYQLSQAASSAVVFSVEISSLPPIASSDAVVEFSIATLCGWHTPRGPPTA